MGILATDMTKEIRGKYIILDDVIMKFFCYDGKKFGQSSEYEKNQLEYTTIDELGELCKNPKWLKENFGIVAKNININCSY